MIHPYSVILLQKWVTVWKIDADINYCAIIIQN